MKKPIVNKVVLCCCLGVLIPLLDHLTKFLVRTFMDVGDSIPVIKNFFHLTYVLNDGMAFGMAGDNMRWVFMLLTPVSLIAITAYLVYYFKKLDTLSCASLTMILMGGASNMVDRIFFINLDPASSGLFDGRVVDMLDFCGIWNAVFNVADSFVVVGVFLFLFAFIRNDLKEAKAKKRALQSQEGAQVQEESADNSQKDEQHD
ncbi:MAG: signal peptidase II [Clostridia bacterium]|nr:signal peptidase II [Clostridia bacterium]